MIDPEELEPDQQLEPIVRSAFQIQEPDQLFIDRLEKKLEDRINDNVRSTESKNIFSGRAQWMDKSKLLLSPLSWGAIGIIFILLLIWGIKTLIPRVEPARSTQPSPTPVGSPLPALVPTQAGDTEGVINLPTLVGMPVPWPEEATTSRNADQITLLARWGRDPISTVTWALDGKSFAVTSFNNIYIYDSATFEVINMIDTGSRVYQIAFSPDGTKLASLEYDGSSVKIWDVASATELQTLMGPENISGLYFSPEGVILATGMYDTEGALTLWDPDSGQELRTICGSVGYQSTFSPDWSILATVSEERKIKLWNTSSGEELRTLAGHSDYIYGITFSPDGSRLVSWSGDFIIKLWDVATGNEQSTLNVENSVITVTFSLDGKPLAYTGQGNLIRLWDITSGQVLREIGDGTLGSDIVISPDRTMAFFYRWGGNEIVLLDIISGEELRRLDWQSYNVTGLDVSPDGRIVAAGLDSGQIKLLDAANGQELRTLTGHTAQVVRLAFSPDGTLLASGSFDITVKLWDVASGKELHSMEGVDISWFGGMPSVAFSPNGQFLAYGAPRGQVKFWDIANNNELHVLGGVPEGGIADDVNSVAFSPDGQILAAGYGSGSITIWDAISGQELHTLTVQADNMGHQSMTDLTFSPDGKILASGSTDLKIKLWDATSWSELRTMSIPGEPEMAMSTYIISLTFSPDGEVLAAGSEYGSITLWDTASGKELNSLVGSAYALAFSPDGRVMVTGSLDTMFLQSDGMVRLWGITPPNTVQSEPITILPSEGISPTQEPSPTAFPEELNIEKIPIPVLVTGDNLQWGSWSMDGSYFYYTDQGPLNEPAPNQAIKSLSFLDTRTGGTCPGIQETVTYTQNEWGLSPEGIDLTERARWTDDNRLMYISPSGDLLALTPCSDSTDNWSASLPDAVPSFGWGGSIEGSQILLKGEQAYWLFTPSTRQSLKLDLPAPQEGKEISLDWSPWEPKLISSRIEERQGELWVVLAYIDTSTGSSSLITEFQASPELQNGYPMFVGVGWMSKTQILVGDISSWARLYDLSSQPIQFTNLFPDLFGMEFPSMGNISFTNIIQGTGGQDYHLTFATGFDPDGQYYIYHTESGKMDRYPLDPPHLLVFPTGQGDIASSYMGIQPLNNTYRVIFVDSDREPYDLVAKGHTPVQNSWSFVTFLPGAQRVMFSSIQGISLVDINSGDTVNFWGLENQEQYADFTSMLLPDGKTVVGFASSKEPGQGYVNQAMYWLRLEP